MLSIIIIIFEELKVLETYTVLFYSQLHTPIIVRLHLHNLALKESQSEKEGVVDASVPQYISKFGFHCPTSCGLISMPNDWEESWIVSHIYCVFMSASHAGHQGALLV